MRRQSLHIEGDDLSEGLSDIHMTGLGPVVAVFGRNGAGKSRLLRTLKRLIAEEVGFLRSGGEDAIRDTVQYLDAARRMGSAADPKQIPSLDARVRTLSSAKERLREYSVPPTPESMLVDLTADGLEVPDIGTMQIGELRALGDQVGAAQSAGEGAGGFGRLVAPIFHTMAWAVFNRDRNGVDREAAAPWLAAFERAQLLVDQMMGGELEVRCRGFVPGPELDGRSFVVRELSRGQQALLTYITFLVAGFLEKEGALGSATSDAIVIVDEPELHLHPAALGAFLRNLREVVGESGQVWLGTHSVSLTAELEQSERWLIERGRVFAPGAERLAELFEALVGGERGLAKLRLVIDEPYFEAANRFVAECLGAAGVSEFIEGDPQLAQLSAFIASAISSRGRLVVLDIGAGRGRLAAEIRSGPLRDRIRYIAIEPNEDLHPLISHHILPDSGWEVRSSIDGIAEGFADIAVVCNVLHEVPPPEWPQFLSEIIVRTRRDGQLVICEDQLFPSGENPHQIGYCVLGLEEIKELLQVSSELESVMPENPRYRHRLLCVAASARVCSVNRDSATAAVRRLRDRTMATLAEMRNEKSEDPREGRRFGFLTQMAVNCEFALRELQADDD